MKFCCEPCGHVYLETADTSTPFIAKDHVPCPKCGSDKIRGHVLIEETIRMFDSMSVKAKDDAGVFLKMKAGGSLSSAGTVATIEQVIDKRKGTYKKKVILADGTVAKDVEGPLSDQSLHGPPKKNG